MFLGEFLHKIDSKNRIMIPAEFREDLSSDFYLTKGPEASLVVYTEEEFKKRCQRLEELSYQSKNNRAMKRLFYSSTVKTSLDKQGRVLINKQLKEYASLTGDCMIVGNNTNFEIWDLAHWQEYIGEVEVNLSDIMDED